MQLPVINPPLRLSPAERRAIAADLRRVCRGEVRLGRHDRLLYATDASMYQIEPLGVVIPADLDDAHAAVAFCAARGLPILPRGGGTSLAGQCTSESIVIDLSPACRAIGAIEPYAGPVWVAGEETSAGTPGHASVVVEAGVSIDELNAELARRKSGLFFAPDPATTAQSAIGGNIGNNAAGARSIRYGRTSENLLAIDAILARPGDASRRAWFQRAAPASSARELARSVAAITRDHAALIRERYPKTLRQNAGLGLDRMLAQLDRGSEPADLDLAQLLCGSEGTLAVTLAARLLLRPVPRARGLALLAFPSVDSAIEAVRVILPTGPSAVELVDDVVIEAARGNRECSPFVDAFPRLPGSDRDPAAVLYVEYHAPAGADELREHFAALRSALPGTPTRELTDGPAMTNAWRLRKAGEPLLHGLPGRRKPLTFIEDNAVPPPRLGEFVRRLRTIVEREGTRAAFWAHASVGVLHVRPMLDPHDPDDLERLRRIAVEAADLARECGGVMSGEHGDGRVRGPLLERFFGPQLVRAFAQVKQAFDPAGLLNPGNIIGAGSIDSITERTRIAPQPAGVDGRGKLRMSPPSVPTVSTYYDYDDQTDFAHAVEMCNGSGVCRKTSGGTMCPSYRATLDERHSTRGRANALRLAITGQLGGAPGLDGSLPPAWADGDTIDTLALCLSCKACKSECPSNVDVARLKAEFTAQRYRERGEVPLAALAIGHVRRLNALGSLAPGVANWFNALPPVRAIINTVLGIHPRRSLPEFSRSWASRSSEWASTQRALPPDAPVVALFADCFTSYNESDVGVSACRVLGSLGYRVRLVDAGCCGRSMISVGMLEQAIQTADRALDRLAAAGVIGPTRDTGPRGTPHAAPVRALLLLEPSCLSAVKDDWLQLRCATPLAQRRGLAAKSWLVEEFIDREWERHPDRALLDRACAREQSPPRREPILFHGHCHQKALWGAAAGAAALKRIAGDRVNVLDTGCCGMAGSFGYDRDKFDVAMAIADLPAHQGGLVRQLAPAASGGTVCAPGTSCRHQIKDATARGSASPVLAFHPVQVLERMLNAGE